MTKFVAGQFVQINDKYKPYKKHRGKYGFIKDGKLVSDKYYSVKLKDVNQYILCLPAELDLLLFAQTDQEFVYGAENEDR